MRRFDDAEDRPPEDLTAWLAAGLRRVEALAWRRWNFTLDETRRWRKAGVPEALTAAQWQTAGVTPDTVGDWHDAKISAAEAVRWHEFGFSLPQAREHTRNGRGPVDAYQQQHGRTSSRMASAVAGRGPMAQSMQAFMNANVPHQVVGGYLQARWVDTEAVEWAKQGIEAWNARVWQAIGLTPAEAGELQKLDREPLRIVQEWWRAGIPYDEVADWLGAGLSAEEAVEQRASGVTVEQAAALRALRRGGAR